MRLFGRSSNNTNGNKKKTPDTPQESIMHMKGTAEMLERKEQHLMSKIAAEEQAARVAASASNRPAALLSLKRKRLYEQQLEHTRGARFNLETQIIAIENANINLETLGAMRSGSAAMKSIHGSMDLDKVDQTVDDIREQMDLAQEISAAIAQPVTGFDLTAGGMDEEDLMKELEQMEQEELDKSLLGAAAVPKVPVVTNNKVSTPSPVFKQPLATTQKDVDEEEELKRLQESMLG